MFFDVFIKYLRKGTHGNIFNVFPTGDSLQQKKFPAGSLISSLPCMGLQFFLVFPHLFQKDHFFFRFALHTQKRAKKYGFIPLRFWPLQDPAEERGAFSEATPGVLRGRVKFFLFFATNRPFPETSSTRLSTHQFAVVGSFRAPWAPRYVQWSKISPVLSPLRTPPYKVSRVDKIKLFDSVYVFEGLCM